MNQNYNLNKIAMVLSGKCPKYYKGTYNKYDFINKVNFIGIEVDIGQLNKISRNDEDFFKMALSIVENYSKTEKVDYMKKLLSELNINMPDNIKEIKKDSSYNSNLNIVKFAKYLSGEFISKKTYSTLEIINLLYNCNKVDTSILDAIKNNYVNKYDGLTTTNEIKKLLLEIQSNFGDESIIFLAERLGLDQKFLKTYYEKIKDEVFENNDEINFKKISKYFSGKLPNSKKITISDFLHKLNDKKIFIPIDYKFNKKYEILYGTMTKDYQDLFNDIYINKGINTIQEILYCFNIPINFIISQDYNSSNCNILKYDEIAEYLLNETNINNLSKFIRILKDELNIYDYFLKEFNITNPIKKEDYKNILKLIKVSKSGRNKLNKIFTYFNIGSNIVGIDYEKDYNYFKNNDDTIDKDVEYNSYLKILK